ncbi:hypothetical protein KEM60_02090 [Austwickia sp. TVS 96-490-7B]|uniref:O-antigen ligase family protein n=1 Tax=Austwickia sp. TVS 96-490-7B TaxID=2830843 RepID=UPI001C57FAA8|nr:O-antigen ligase family protein [Austwickia sp. TVS 96-490-7B]MBW3085879.1 hypothetical protein [Austwickia sp. TVS 96-490-7B]
MNPALLRVDRDIGAAPPMTSTDEHPPAPAGRLAGLLTRYPLAQKALLILPVLAVAGPFASIRPGAAGFPYFYRIVWFLCLAVAVPLFWWESRRHSLPKLYAGVLAWWLIWAPITWLWTPAPGVGRTEIMAGAMAMAGAFVVVVLTRGSSASLRYLRWGWMVAFAVNTAIVSWEFCTGNHLDLVTGVQPWYFSAYSVAGLDTNPNGLSNFNVAIFAVLCAQMVREVGSRRATRAAAEAFENEATTPTSALVPSTVCGSISQRIGLGVRGSARRIIVLYVAMALCAYTVYMTGSRAGAMSQLLLTLMTAAWCFRGRRLLVVPIALVALAAVIPVVQQSDLRLVRPAAVAQRAAHEGRGSGHYQDNVSDDQKAVDVAKADAARAELTKSGLRAMAEKPLQGHGAGSSITWVAHDPLYPATSANGQRRVINLHNTFLEIGVNYGLIGLLPILAVPLWALMRFLRPRTFLRLWPDPVVLEGLGVLLALLVTSVITSSSIGSPMFWLFYAYAAALAWNYQDAARADLRAQLADGGPADGVPATVSGR